MNKRIKSKKITDRFNKNMKELRKDIARQKSDSTLNGIRLRKLSRKKNMKNNTICQFLKLLKPDYRKKYFADLLRRQVN